MTNEELKKKIKEILRKRMTELLGSCHTDEIPLTEEGAEAILFYADEFADALIAAGIGDVKEAEMAANRYEMLYKMQSRDMALAERKAYKSEHRAEVAERALQIADALGELCGEKEYYTKRAERELQEERNDE